MHRCLATLALIWLFVPSAPAQDSLPERIEAVIRGPDYKQAHWGLLVVDSESGKVVFEHNADKLFAPASTTKLYTCAAALGAFGPDYKFSTAVYRRGELSDGRLAGDLILVASGDLTLGGRTLKDETMAFTNHDHTYATPTSTDTSVTDTNPLAGLEALAKQVREAGVRQVRDVLIDDRLFPAARGSGSGPDQLTPIVVNDNVVDVIVEPGPTAGTPAKIRIRPPTASVQWDAQVTTADKGTSPTIDVVAAGKQRFTVRGRIGVDAKPMVRTWNVDEPPVFARALLIEALRREGVAVNASPLQAQGELPPRDAYEKLTRVASFTSPPLSEAIKVTLKVSHNLYASTLPLLIAAKNGQTTIPAGLRWQKKFLVDLGVPAETISFAGGAGGAQADCATPRATVKLLQAMRQRKEYPAWHAGFPILGVDGTLAEAVGPESPARGKVQAKTGTLTWFDGMNSRTLLKSKALAGTLTTQSGKELLIAMFVNDVPLPLGVTATREGRVLGRLCEIICRYGP
jgi:D-alanyl-D-alanine carboxypeptidase/D-alanyl-D-alanine-endopeptidase (penicillin-binding protein 4)